MVQVVLEEVDHLVVIQLNLEVQVQLHLFQQYLLPEAAVVQVYYLQPQTLVDLEAVLVDQDQE